MKIREYSFKDEGGMHVNPLRLRSEWMSREDYEKAQAGTVILCQDVFIEYDDGSGPGILLVNRRQHPAKNEMWPIGGRYARGFHNEESLRKKVLGETGLNIHDIEPLGIAPTMFPYNEFGNGKGTHTVNIVYSAKAEEGQTLRLDHNHEQPKIVRREDYTSELQDKLQSYVTDFMNLIIRP